MFQREMSAEMFLVLELPDTVNPDNMKATIENEVLEVILAKANPRKKNGVETKKAA